MKKNKIIRNIIILLLVIFVGGIGIALWMGRDRVTTDKEVVKLKENVIVLMVDAEENKYPIEVLDNKLVFNEPVSYKMGDVIVSGIIDAAPNGFIRKVISVSQNGEEYIVETENGVLTDVFEELHITRTFALTENGLDEGEIVSIQNSGVIFADNMEFMQESMPNYRYATTTTLNNNHTKSDDLNAEYQFTLPFEVEMSENISAQGEVGVNIWLEIEIDIHKGDIIFGIVAHDNTDGNLCLECSADGKKQFEKEIFSKRLPNFQFLIGTVPVVVTNELQAKIEGETNVEGDISTSVELRSENSLGFLYTSKTNEIEEINERSYRSDGMSWQTETKAEGDCSAGISLHLISTLYGSTGSDISIAIVGKVDGEVGVILSDISNEVEYVGSIDMSVAPQICGNIVVTVPIIDKQLVNKPIFERNLPAFWEEHWDSGTDWSEKLEQIGDKIGTTLILNEMQNGDFSAFSGTYKATDFSSEEYGDDGILPDLILNDDGTVTGGTPSWSPELYPRSAPKSVTYNEEGAYVCEWGQYRKRKDCKYTIYPEGVLDEWMELCKQYYLKDKVYIICYMHSGKGASDGPLRIVYYKDE